MTDNNTTDPAKSENRGAESPALPPRKLFVVDKMEIDAVLLVPVPPHPNTIFDDDEFRMLVAHSTSLIIKEKIEIVVKVGEFSQKQVNSFLEILRRERETFERLNEKHNKRVEELEQKHAAEWAELDNQADEVKPTMEELSPGEKAGLVYRASQRLLTPIGTGEAQKFFAAFVQRLAWNIEQGGPGVLEGEIPQIFASELRNPELNAAADDSGSDMRLINALVRPALSKLRKSLATPTLYHKGSVFAVALVIEGPEQPRGRVKQKYRIGVFVRSDSLETGRLMRKRRFIRYILATIGGRATELIALSDLGPFGPIIRRVVEKIGYTTEEDRAESTFEVTAAVLDLILASLGNDQRLQFLMYILRLPIRWAGAVPTSDFDNWFLNAVELNDGLEPTDESYDYNVGRFQSQLRYAPFLFPTRLLLLKAYHLSPLGLRWSLVAQLALLDRGRIPGITETEWIYRPATTVDLQAMLERNTSDVADFLRLVEAKTIETFTRA